MKSGRGSVMNLGKSLIYYMSENTLLDYWQCKMGMKRRGKEWKERGKTEWVRLGAISVGSEELRVFELRALWQIEKRIQRQALKRKETLERDGVEK